LTLRGTKLQGQLALKSMHRQGRGKAQWLLIKKQDAFARLEGRTGANARERRSTATDKPRSRTPPQAAIRKPARGRRTFKPSAADPTFTHTEKLRYLTGS
jgi:hypothetical protein